MQKLNPDYSLASSIKPGNREHMLTAPLKISEVFRDPENAVKWISIQIAACARRANVTAPRSELVIETARIIYTRFSFVPISHMALFFGFMMQGQRYDEWGEVEHYGTFDLNKIIDELTRASRKMMNERCTILDRKKRKALREEMQKIEPFDLNRAMQEEPEKYGRIAHILRICGKCGVIIHENKNNA